MDSQIPQPLVASPSASAPAFEPVLAPVPAAIISSTPQALAAGTGTPSRRGRGGGVPTGTRGTPDVKSFAASAVSRSTLVALYLRSVL
jgi:hypothetical protein